jgi:DNA-binding transcriptional regulator LsrR (DeoR family)
MHEIQKTKPNGAKYDIDTVKYIRYLYEQENMSNQEIADKLSIPRGTIYQITSYRRWKYA